MRKMELSSQFISDVQTAVNSQNLSLLGNNGYWKSCIAGNSTSYVQAVWNEISVLLREEIIAIFLRLTQYPDNSLVSLQDVLTKDHPYYLGKTSPKNDTFDYHMLYNLFYLQLWWIDRALVTLQAKMQLPAEYLSTSHGFEKTSVLNEALLSLDHALQDFHGGKI